MNTKTTQPRPFLKWAGGKSRIASKITATFPSSKRFKRYYEPFLGSGAIYFKIAPQEGYLNDLNPHLINTYKTIKSQPEELMEYLDYLESTYNNLDSLEEQAFFYYQIREDYNNLNDDELQKSANFIFLNKAGWNGMYRENADKGFNIPFGKHTRLKLYDYNNIMAVSRSIQGMQFTSGDYSSAVKNARHGDLIYFDPPYFPVSKTANFTAYQKEGFNEREQIKLFEIAEQLSEMGCYIAISNSDTKESRKLYNKNQRFKIQIIPTMRTIGSKCSSRGVVNEILVTNF